MGESWFPYIPAKLLQRVVKKKKILGRGEQERRGDVPEVFEGSSGGKRGITQSRPHVFYTANGVRTSAFRQGGAGRRLKVLRAKSVFSGFPGFQRHTDPLIRSAGEAPRVRRKNSGGEGGQYVSDVTGMSVKMLKMTYVHWVSFRTTGKHQHTNGGKAINSPRV